MIPSNSLEGEVAPLKLEAIDWAARLAIGPVSDAERREFDTWRRSSPAHEDAFRMATEFMGELRALKLPAMEMLIGENVVRLHRPKLAMSRRAFMGGGAVAASLAGLAAAQSPLGLWPRLAELMADERTRAGERRSFSPTAGVDVELNSRSSVSVIDHGVRLIAGEIFVSVADRGEPFRVDADGTVATTRTASFNVRSLGSDLCVTCLDGYLVSARGGSDVRLGPGEAVTYPADGSARRSSADLEAVTAWRRGLLIFRGTPLGSAIAEINRHFPGRLVLGGRGLGERTVTGVFHIDQIELAVVQIQQLTGVSATRLPGDVVLLGW